MERRENNISSVHVVINDLKNFIHPPIELDVQKIHLFLLAFINHRILALDVESDVDRDLFKDLFQGRERPLN